MHESLHSRRSCAKAQILRQSQTLDHAASTQVPGRTRARLLRMHWSMTDTQTGASTPESPTEVKARLLSDHRGLEEFLGQLESAIEGADAPQLCEQWTRFELSLRDHLDTEERYLFPLVAATHRREVEALRAEHQHIRCALSELGVAVDLHTVRKASVDELIAYLKQHALREERSLYQWIDHDPAAHHGLRAMFARRSPRSIASR